MSTLAPAGPPALPRAGRSEVQLRTAEENTCRSFLALTLRLIKLWIDGCRRRPCGPAAARRIRLPAWTGALRPQGRVDTPAGRDVLINLGEWSANLSRHRSPLLLPGG